ncbi:MAG: SDR family oxidoreductase [Actinomycetota bacterium]
MKTAFITGASRGIGRATALRFAADGASIAVGFFRNRSKAEAVCAELEGCGVKALPVKVHTGDLESISRAFDAVAEVFGSLDVFVSNAASGVLRPLVDVDARGWDWTMNVNARGFLLGAQRAAQLMPDGGSIVALTSAGSTHVLPGYGAVGASKAALESLVRYLAVELGPRVRVNAVSPGVVDTDALTHFPDRDQLLGEAVLRTPVGRLVTPEEVAGSVAFLCSPAADMIRGHILVVDGGASLLA